MSEFKFQLSTFALVALLAFGGYWAFSNLNRGFSYSKEEVVELPTEVVGETTDPIVVGEEVEPVEEAPVPEETTPVALSEANSQTLTELKKLVVDDIYMKEGSHGTRVGTVQKFLNLYFDESSTVDNDYGPGTLSKVKTFQEEQGLDADGLAGPSTYEQMIKLLESGKVS